MYHNPVDINPFSTAVPFWGQTNWNLSGVSPNRDLGANRASPLGDILQRRKLAMEGYSV